MGRQLTAAIAGLLVVIFGCGKPPVTTPVVGDGSQPTTTAPAVDGGKNPPETKGPQAGWKTVKGVSNEVNYTLQIPENWTWKNGIGDKGSFDRFIMLNVKSSRVFSDEISPEQYAKGIHDDRKSGYTTKNSSEIGKLRDHRVIKVGGVDAAWIVFAHHGDAGGPTAKMLTHCWLRDQGTDFMLEGDFFDGRPDRKESDVAEAQAVLLKICQSFRAEPKK